MIIPNVSVPEGVLGDYEIKKKTFEDDPMYTARMRISGRNYIPGTYTFLYRGSTLVMSDTPDEKQDHIQAVIKAKGNCLIAGLGIGMVLNAVCLKEEVEHVDVVEISQEVIDLVSEYYDNKYPDKITFHCADILQWQPPKNIKYDMAWFDIWDNLCTDNLDEMATLHRRFGRKAEWKGSWGKEILVNQKRKETYYRW